jgi:serine protease SohB
MWYQSFIGFIFFALSVILVCSAIVFVIVSFFSLLVKAKQELAAMSGGGVLTIKNVSDDYVESRQEFLAEVLDKKAYKKHAKEQKKKSSKKTETQNNRVYVLDFKGDMQASQVEGLRKEITAILAVANKHDEIVVRIDSPGGVVNGYGFAAAQLERIRNANIELTVCIDQIAASGGYMMSAVANTIISAPFAIVGSIGVVGTVPNIKELLTKNGINVEMHTSGEYKRTLTSVGENTDEGRKKFKEDLHNIHELFKQHILSYRSTLDMSKVATGEYWFGKDALLNGLVDKLQTYDDYIIDKINSDNDIYEVSYVVKKEKGFFKSKLAMIRNSFTNFLYSRNIL